MGSRRLQTWESPATDLRGRGDRFAMHRLAAATDGWQSAVPTEQPDVAVCQPANLENSQVSINLLKRSAIGAALFAAGLVALPTHAGVVTLDVTGISSYDAFGSLGNERRFIDLAPNTHIIGIFWDVNLTAFAQSWLSEMGVDLSDGVLAGLSLFPGVGAYAPGTSSYSGAGDLVALGFDFYLGASGRLHFEFFESFTDLAGAGDGIWNSGTLRVAFVPEPATYGLAALALLGVAATSRRKRT